MAFVFDERWGACGELLQHVGDGGGSDAETLRQSVAGYAVFFRATKSQDGLEVVVYGLAVRVGLTAGRHGGVSSG